MNRRIYAAIAIMCFLGLFVASIMAPEFLNQKPGCGDIIAHNVVDPSGSRSVRLAASATHPNVDIAVNSLEVKWNSNVDGTFAIGRVTNSGDIKLQTSDLSEQEHILTLTVSDESGKSCQRCIGFYVGDDTEAMADTDCYSEESFSFAKPWDSTSKDGKTITGVWPFGADGAGVPLSEYASQGARIIAFPAVISGCLVAFLAILGGLLRCTNTPAVEGVVQAFSELVGFLEPWWPLASSPNNSHTTPSTRSDPTAKPTGRSVSVARPSHGT